MDLMKIGTQALMQQFTKQGANPSEGMVQKALSGLLGGGAGGGLGIASLLGVMQKGGMASQLSSWIGSGANEEMTADQVEQTVGADKLQNMAESMGMDVDQVKSGLQGALPNIIDQASPAGKLPDSLGGIASMASGLFGK